MLGCHDARNAVTIKEIICPQCREIIEVFVRDGKVHTDAVCEECGHRIESGVSAEKLKCD